ncbi:hypothetical protein GCM10009678_72130 [Actinomadura kijaniata]|uniref:Uncharacterized protein n=1 Tax=Actinomadura namibiensis TaxID=182080 RepID=A0A7W3LYL3_ACTNM|nr:hypothetical protein [Actinomadura namibiensis]MBA8956603.1 hypothetical protein [Actinomadura namibiensis]
MPIPTVAGLAALAPWARSHLPMTRILKSLVQERVPEAPLFIRTGIGMEREPLRIKRPYRVSVAPSRRVRRSSRKSS